MDSSKDELAILAASGQKVEHNVPVWQERLRLHRLELTVGCEMVVWYGRCFLKGKHAQSVVTYQVLSSVFAIGVLYRAFFVFLLASRQPRRL